MKKNITCLLLFSVLLSSLTGCFSYLDMNRVLFYTMGVGDYQDDNFLFYGEAFKAYRGQGEKAGIEKRIVLFGKGKSLTDAVDRMRNTVNYPIDYAGNKSFVYSERLARHGIGGYLDIVARDQKPSYRVYQIVYSGEVDEMMNMTMEDEQFLGLYLYQMMNSQKSTVSVITTQYYQFITNMDIGSEINLMPILKSTTVEKEAHGDAQASPSVENSGGSNGGSSGGSSGGSNGGSSGGSQNAASSPSKQALTSPYVKIDGAAIFIRDKMVDALTNDEIETYKLLSLPVHSGLLNTQNPSYPGLQVGFTILKNSHKAKVTMVDGRIQLQYDVQLRVVLLEAQKGIEYNEETLEKLKSNLKSIEEEQAKVLFYRMQQENIDLFNVKRLLELKRIPVEETYLSNTDFHVNFDVILDGYGELKKAYY